MSKLCFNIFSNFVNNILGSFYDALLILIIFIVLRWLFVYFQTYVVINKINGPKPYLFLGNILNIRKKYGKYISNYHIKISLMYFCVMLDRSDVSYRLKKCIDNYSV